MRYQHPEIEIVRTALNQGTGNVAVTKPCSHTPCAGSFVATIQFPRAYRLERGGKRGPSTGVRVSAKRQRSPLVLSPEEVKLGLSQLEFRDQLSRKVLKSDLRVFEDTGVSFMRNGREVYMGPLAAITGRMGSKDPWWRLEVDFPATLDVYRAYPTDDRCFGLFPRGRRSRSR
jgi:hypothetical protein